MAEAPASPLATPIPWNLVAAAYTTEIVPMFEAYAQDALAIAKLAAGDRVVDVACGPGTLSMLAARAGARVDAIDFSPGMIAQFKTRLAHHGLAGVTPVVGDGQTLPFEPGTFAAGFSMFGLMFFPDRAKGFAELRRVLAPGARAVISSWAPLEETPALAAMFGVLRVAMGKALGAPPTAPTELPLTTEASCRDEMAAAFRDVEVRRISHTQQYASAEALWGSLQRTMAPVALMKQSLGERWTVVSDAASAAIRGALGAGAVEMTMTAFVTSGVA